MCVGIVTKWAAGRRCWGSRAGRCRRRWRAAGAAGGDSTRAPRAPRRRPPRRTPPRPRPHSARAAARLTVHILHAFNVPSVKFNINCVCRYLTLGGNLNVPQAGASVEAGAQQQRSAGAKIRRHRRVLVTFHGVKFDEFTYLVAPAIQPHPPVTVGSATHVGIVYKQYISMDW